MVKNVQKLDDSKLHWFWDLTTKKWFFLVLYFSLTLLLLIYANVKYRAPAPALLGFIVSMPIGLLYLFGLFNKSELQSFIFVCVFYIFMVSSIIYLNYIKYKKGIILKWLIIILILLMILSFAGCVAYLGANGYPIGA